MLNLIIIFIKNLYFLTLHHDIHFTSMATVITKPFHCLAK